jgi:hypothetical protein
MILTAKPFAGSRQVAANAEKRLLEIRTGD